MYRKLALALAPTGPSRLMLAAAASLALSAPVMAGAPGPQVPLQEIFGAYQAICYAHPGDGKAQIAAATAAPYNFKPGPASDDGTSAFENGRLSLRVVADASHSFCMVLGDVAASTDLAQGEAVAAQLLGKPTVENADDEGKSTAIWTGKSGDLELAYIYIQMTGEGRTVSGYMLGAQ